ncbi:MAG: EF2563 family selenium-dependent molybdenum hydroxylase system protein [Lachnospiraceae bacterium]|nr:EF2563 family selenium-dependent molybdenum hydroxylase system protein [Lachnospiraceae bacterium]
MNQKTLKILVRGAGDIASGIIWNLAYAGFKVVCIDIEKPSCIRTEVAYSSAIYDGVKELNGITCVYAKNESEVDSILSEGKVALLVDEDAKILDKIKFDVVVDAILAKKNLGTNINMAELVIGVGPGFTAKVDCHYAIETMRGHLLGKIYETGSPLANTGIPGLIASHSKDRVMHSPAEGIFHNKHKIGDTVKKDEVLAEIEECENGKPTGKVVTLNASIDGLLRGILRDGYYATKGLKASDIDPRLTEYDNCFTISDKARSIGGAVLAIVLHHFSKDK